MGLLLLVPFLVEAGTWEQSTQKDFGQGTIDPGLEVKNGTVKLLDGIIYEDAEDGNTDNWIVHDKTLPGTITNVYDKDLKSNVIELDNNQAGLGTGYRYGSPYQGLLMAQMKIKSPGPFSIYFCINTTNGHRYIHLLFVNGQDKKFGDFLQYPLGTSLVNDKWHTIDRNLQEDLHKFEPNNDIVQINGIYFRGGGKIDDINFYSGKSTYTSSILDLGKNKVSSFEKISWEADTPSGTGAVLQTRTSADGKNWSDWSKEYATAAGEKVESPANRYLQYQAGFSTTTATSVPTLKKVAIEYNHFPLTPDSLSPEDGKVLANQDRLKWSKAIDSDPEDSLTYSIELDDSAQFQSVDSVTTGLKATKVIIDQLDNFQNLKDGVKYFWRIKTVDNHNAQSDYSTARNFVLDKTNIAPQAPQSGFNPGQGGTVKVLKPTIYWGAATDSDLADSAETLSYLVQLDDNSKFDSADIFSVKAGVTRLTVPNDLDDNIQYYYRIKTKDDEGAESGWSAAQTFVVATGKNPDIRVAKTVKINEDSDGSAHLPYLFGSLRNNLSGFDGYLYLLTTLAALFIFTLLLKRSQYLKAVVGVGKLPVKKEHPTSQPILYNVDSNLPSDNKGVGVATRVQGGRTKTIVTVLLIGAMAAAAAGVIRYYQENPSPYKDDGKEIAEDDTLTYRIDYSNKGKTKATNFNIADTIPAGSSYIAGSAKLNETAQTDTEDSDQVSYGNNKVKFKLGDVLSETSGYVTFQVKVDNVPENGKITNIADVIFGESDGVQASNQVSNPIKGVTTSVSTASISGLVWHDSNGDKAQSENESGIEKATIKLYQDSDNNGALEENNDILVEEAETDYTGLYNCDDLSAGTYIVQLDESSVEVEIATVTTENNPQILEAEGGQEYSDVNFGVGFAEDSLITDEVTGKISGSVWHDSNQDNSKDADEVGLADINVKLFEDSNSNDTLETDTDLYVTVTSSDANGDYNFNGLSAKHYLVVIENAPAGYQSVAETNSQLVELTSDNEEKAGINFSYYALTEESDEEVKTVTTITPDYYGGIPTVITTSDEEEKSGTVAVTPLKIGKTKAGQVQPPALTHIGATQVDDFSKKYSVDLGDDLALRGKTGANYKVTIYIYSDLNFKTTTTADKDGIWDMTVNPKTFKAGEHKILAQSEDSQGGLSEKVEIARFVVNASEGKGEVATLVDNTTIYWVALLALLIIAAMVVAITWIREGKKSQ
ncbi:MAG: SdrD B-like domain-containing protein, partial [Parcubacteria group bacterium]